jgi:hypothetical protein
VRHYQGRNGAMQDKNNEHCRNCSHWAAEWMLCKRHDMKTDTFAYCPEWREIIEQREEQGEKEHSNE